ncbi:MAG: hypothetical protein B7Y95_20485 [Rhizobiales bacterium 32-66-11]|jgi:archaellum component FlaG (FlaF/FlaG flagellin family)|nr:MAG: hypothetical protein B7Y95_20485 [Rhizobiales bacterium 32-66-11]
MAIPALILLLASLAGAAASWGVAIREGMRAEAASGSLSAGRQVLLVLWPFSARLREGAAGDHARRVGKALILFIASLTVAAAAASAYSNLTRQRPVPPAPASVSEPASSKS